MVGDFYRVPNATEPLPTVLLQHMLSGNRDQWLPLIPPLLEAGYHVLTVDLRGFGETRGTRSMEGSIDDTRFWFEWLHAQPDVQGDALALVGGSFGAVPALARLPAASRTSALNHTVLVAPAAGSSEAQLKPF